MDNNQQTVSHDPQLRAYGPYTGVEYAWHCGIPNGSNTLGALVVDDAKLGQRLTWALRESCGHFDGERYWVLELDHALMSRLHGIGIDVVAHLLDIDRRHVTAFVRGEHQKGQRGYVVRNGLLRLAGLITS